MNKQEKKRIGLFEKYKENLNFLVANGFIKQDLNVYLCPICLEPYDKINVINPLTLEDAPPKKLGGKANTLTCKECNNNCGSELDAHLIERMRELDKPKLHTNSKTNIEMEIDGETIRSEMIIDENGNQKHTTSIKNNNPYLLTDKMKVGKKIENIIISRKPIKKDNLEYALLKTAYLMAFEKYGYLFILDKSYDIVREQLKNPNERIYPKGFWITQELPETFCGTYLLLNKELKSFVSNFILDTGKSKTMFIVMLPLPNSKEQIFITSQKLQEKLKSEKVFNMNFYPNPNIDKNYLSNINHITELNKNLE
jgi:hypothetical protein